MPEVKSRVATPDDQLQDLVGSGEAGWAGSGKTNCRSESRLCTFTKILVGKGMPSLMSFVFSLNSLQNWLMETPRCEGSIRLSAGGKGRLPTTQEAPSVPSCVSTSPCSHPLFPTQSQLPLYVPVDLHASSLSVLTTVR